MGLEIVKSVRGLLSVRVTEELNESEVAQIKAAMLEMIQQSGRIRVLVIVENFRGWRDGPVKGQMAKEDSEKIEKMAILSNDNWREAIVAFAKNFSRSTEIECFTPDERERVVLWVIEGV
jgi:hypothetical protein